MRTLIVKELRALLPLWLLAAAGAGAVGAAGWVGELVENGPRAWPSFQLVMLVRGGLELAGGAAFVIGAVALGAWSMGQEYVHRTLPVLLAQPVSRTQVFGAKALVLAALLAGLAVLAVPWWAGGDPLATVLQSGPRVLDAAARGAPTGLFLVLAPLIGVSVAPWLTILCRRAMAGVVMSLAVPASLWLLGEIVRARRYGVLVVPDDYTFSATLVWAGTLAIGAVALVAAPFQFRRLEALEEPGAIPVARSLARYGISGRADPGARHRHPVVVLLAKELRLQSVTLLLPVLYVLAWAAIVVTGVGDYVLGQTFQSLRLLYVVVTATMLGALASAEERAHGTLACQLLQPMAFWRQWLVKVLAVLGLAGTLTLALPALLERLYALNDQSTFDSSLAASVALCAGGGLYVSSLCSSGLRGLLLTPVFAAAGLAIVSVATTLSLALTLAIVPAEYAILRFPLPALLTFEDIRLAGAVEDRLAEAAGVVGFLVMLWLAAGNHRSLDGLRARWRQQMWLPISVALGAWAVGSVGFFLRWYLATH
jgi:hypothetical protein